MKQSLDSGGTKDGYESIYGPAAKRRIGRGPGGRARRPKKKDKPEKDWRGTDFFDEAKKKEEGFRKESYKKHQGPRGRASRPGAKKLKGKSGSMDYDYRLQWGDRVKDSKGKPSKMVLKPKTKKSKIPSFNPSSRKYKRDVGYWINNHTV